MHKKILFIHHSTGRNLIKEGNLRVQINKLDPRVEFWDHNYNLFPLFTSFLAHTTHLRGLSDNKGAVTGKDFNIVLSNNSPKEYAEIFSRDSNDFTLKSILGYDIIAFKNCYPTTRIKSEEQLEEDILYFKIIQENIKKYPEKQFILVTPPPERKETTSGDNARRAKKLVAWLLSKEFTQGVSNLHIFDFFGVLADENGFLKQEYTRFISRDSHPNKKANETIAPLFAKYLVKIAQS